MENLAQYSNLITLGNILTLITGIGSVVTAVMLVYWKARNFWFDKEQEFLDKVEKRLEAHTVRIENCIHKMPGHPENTNPLSDKPSSSFEA